MTLEKERLELLFTLITMRATINRLIEKVREENVRKWLKEAAKCLLFAQNELRGGPKIEVSSTILKWVRA